MKVHGMSFSSIVLYKRSICTKHQYTWWMYLFTQCPWDFGSRDSVYERTGRNVPPHFMILWRTYMKQTHIFFLKSWRSQNVTSTWLHVSFCQLIWFQHNPDMALLIRPFPREQASSPQKVKGPTEVTGHGLHRTSHRTI